MKGVSLRSASLSWSRLALSLLCLGFAELMAEIAGDWGRFPFRPDWFWCLAVAVSLRVPPLSALMGFAACGLARDLLIGPKAGAGAIAFTCAGWLVVGRETYAPLPGWLLRILAAGPGAAIAACLRMGLELKGSALVSWDKIIILALGHGLLSLAAYVPAELFLSLTAFRPWRPGTD